MDRTVGRLCPWTKYPLIALAIIAIGPSIIAMVLYVGYAVGIIQPPAYGYSFAPDIYVLPVVFAVVNWPFIVLYFACRSEAKSEWPNVRSTRLAMWFSLVAMALPSAILLFTTVPEEMVSNAFGAGQGVGIVLLYLIWPVLLPFTSSIYLAMLMPLPILGLIGWFAGCFIAWATKSSKGAPEADEVIH